MLFALSPTFLDGLPCVLGCICSSQLHSARATFYKHGETKSRVPQLCPGTTTGGRATVANSAHCLPAVRAWPLACGDVSPSRQTRSNQQEAAVDGSVFWPGHRGLRGH